MIRSLFLKIFLWFWLALALVAVAMIFSVPRTPQDAMETRWRGATETALNIYAPQVAEMVELEGTSALPAYLDRIGLDARARIFAFDEQGNEVLGRTGPPGLNEIIARARESNETVFDTSERRMLAAQRGISPGGARYVLVAVTFRRPPPFPLDTGSLPLRLIAVFLTGTVVCYALARYLTAPVVKLRKATRELAGGDLSVRVGASIGKRRDELADLARDFDLMAGRLESLVAAQRRLLGDISHELRSPLARLNIALELARQRAGPDAKSAHDRIEREAERLNSLIGQLLTLTRLESGAEDKAKEPFDLTQLVQEVATDSDFEARSRNRRVRVVESEGCRVVGNARLIRSAIENVVRNAVSYTAEETEVEVTLRCDQNGDRGHAVVRVRDHGPGVPEAALADLFRPFYRVDDTRDRQTGGTGLGLAITERAVRLHGGEVTAANAEDGGLLIEMRLPLMR